MKNKFVRQVERNFLKHKIWCIASENQVDYLGADGRVYHAFPKSEKDVNAYCLVAKNIAEFLAHMRATRVETKKRFAQKLGNKAR